MASSMILSSSSCAIRAAESLSTRSSRDASAAARDASGAGETSTNRPPGASAAQVLGTYDLLARLRAGAGDDRAGGVEVHQCAFLSIVFFFWAR